mmetsp:Transcript_58797/g.108577  ORF Transcript_58797/g.108577 Transcript_58797/m.108577 type:complete len:256 (+) Transcript_58797:558-1325(+)
MQRTPISRVQLEEVEQTVICQHPLSVDMAWFQPGHDAPSLPLSQPPTLRTQALLQCRVKSESHCWRRACIKRQGQLSHPAFQAVQRVHRAAVKGAFDASSVRETRRSFHSRAKSALPIYKVMVRGRFSPFRSPMASTACTRMMTNCAHRRRGWKKEGGSDRRDCACTLKESQACALQPCLPQPLVNQAAAHTVPLPQGLCTQVCTKLQLALACWMCHRQRWRCNRLAPLLATRRTCWRNWRMWCSWVWKMSVGLE